jgi:type II secretory pathway pseudopilin PulG
MNKNERGITLVDLVCGLALAAVLYTFVLLPLAQSHLKEERANLVISLAVHETRKATIQFYLNTGTWPTTKADVVSVTQLMCGVVFVNPYDDQPVEVGLGRPKNKYDVASGAIRLIATTDGSNMSVCGYGSGGRIISEDLCLPF